MTNPFDRDMLGDSGRPVYPADALQMDEWSRTFELGGRRYYVTMEAMRELRQLLDEQGGGLPFDTEQHTAKEAAMLFEVSSVPIARDTMDQLDAAFPEVIDR